MPSSNNNDSIATEVVAASVGGAISAAVLYPLEVLKTKMQSDENNDNNEEEEEKKKSMIAYSKSLYEKEGYAVFIRGIETSSFQSALEKALYFFSYEALKKGYHSLSGGAQLNTGTNLLLGCLAEWAHLPITLPVDAWTTRIQTCSDKTTGPLAILCQMLSEKQTFYKGISAYVILCLKPSLQYTIYEQVKRMVVVKRRDKSLSAVEAFLLGMLARTIATVLVFPCLRAKVIMQTRSSETNTTGSEAKQATVMDLLLDLARSNPSALYQGIVPELTRGVFSAALMLMLKEKIGAMVKQLAAK